MDSGNDNILLVVLSKLMSFTVLVLALTVLILLVILICAIEVGAHFPSILILVIIYRI